MVKEIIMRLNYLKTNSSSANCKISRYILENIDNINRFTISSLAENTNSSYATICRFFKLLGVDGFKDFKKKMINDKTDYSQLIETDNPILDLSIDLTPEIISQRIHDFYSSVISTSHLDAAALEKAIDLLASSDITYCVGLGTSSVSVHYASMKMFRLNMSCAYDTDIIIAKMKASLLTPNSTMLVISSSGRTKSILDIVNTAKSVGAKVISICDFYNSPLANISDVSLCTTIRESNKYVDIDFPLIHEQITIIDVLYTCLSQLKGRNAFEKTKKAVTSDKIDIH